MSKPAVDAVLEKTLLIVAPLEETSFVEAGTKEGGSDTSSDTSGEGALLSKIICQYERERNKR